MLIRKENEKSQIILRINAEYIEIFRKKKNKDKLYMVHLTNFFPKGHKILSNYDGNRMYDTYTRGNTKKCRIAINNNTQIESKIERLKK